MSRAGATMAGLSYAFGGPVLSDYFNIIYLVGAAWVPLGIPRGRPMAAAGPAMGPGGAGPGPGDAGPGGRPGGGLPDHAVRLRLRRRPGAFGGRCTVPAVGVAAWVWRRWRSSGSWAGPGSSRDWSTRAADARARRSCLSAWVVGARGLRGDPAARASDRGSRGDARWAWGRPGPWPCCCRRCRCCPCSTTSPPACDGRRRAGGPLRFQPAPLPRRRVDLAQRLRQVHGGESLLDPILPPAGAHRPSPLSLYVGALPIVLALGAAGFRGGPPWRAWMTAVVLLSFWGSLGEFAGPAGWSADGRPDRRRASGDDSFYGLLTTVLPALRLFRFPFKLLTFTALGLSALSALGWDRFAVGDRPPPDACRRDRPAGPDDPRPGGGRGDAGPAGRRDGGPGVRPPPSSGRSTRRGRPARSCGAWRTGPSPCRRAWPSSSGPPAVGGPPRPRWRWPSSRPTWRSPTARWSSRSRRRTSSASPRSSEAIREAERDDPSPGPFRIQRLPSWVPIGWADSPSKRPASRAGRLGDRYPPAQLRLAARHPTMSSWTRARPASLDQRRLFRPAYRVLDPGLAAALGVEPGRPILYHPRAAFDLWGARYFIIPSYPGDWTDENRSYAAFVDETDLIYPDPGVAGGPRARPAIASDGSWTGTCRSAGTDRRFPVPGSSTMPGSSGRSTATTPRPATPSSPGSASADTAGRAEASSSPSTCGERLTSRPMIHRRWHPISRAR